MKSTSRTKKIIIAVLIALVIIYNIAVNLMISAALVPSFMRKLDAFERVTEQSYSEMVQTDDITENAAKVREETKAFLDSTELIKVQCTSSDGYMLIASVFRQAEPEGRPWAILLHGYTGWKEEMYHHAVKYYERGFNVLCPDLRCQGESEGDYIGMGWTDRGDVLLWINMILDSYPDADIVLQGESMGASCALMLTGGDSEVSLPANVKCVISDCAYQDAMSMFSKQLKDWFGLPDLGFISCGRLWLMIRGGYDLKDADALAQVSKSTTPTLFIHGDQDKIVPQADQDALYEACTAPKDKLTVPGAGHAQSCLKAPTEYYDKIFDFIQAAGVEVAE